MGTFVVLGSYNDCSWYIAKGTPTKVEIEGHGNIKMREWIEETCDGAVLALSVIPNTWLFFEESDDAIKFKLKWKGIET